MMLQQVIEWCREHCYIRKDDIFCTCVFWVKGVREGWNCYFKKPPREWDEAEIRRRMGKVVQDSMNREIFIANDFTIPHWDVLVPGWFGLKDITLEELLLALKEKKKNNYEWHFSGEG